MSWRFRKTFKVMPGVKLNLSRHGVSTTFGKGPFSTNVGPRGVYSNVNIPGTGISYRHKIHGASSQAFRLPQPAANRTNVPALPSIPPVTQISPPPAEIQSASTEVLTSGGLEPLRAVLWDAFNERDALKKEIASATLDSNIATSRYQTWERGLLLKRLFKQSFAGRKEAADTAVARLEELQEQLRLTVLATEITIDQEQAETYCRLRDAFAVLAKCQRIWSILAEKAIDRVVERSKAEMLVNRDSVSFSLNSCDLIQTEQKVPHLPSRTGGDMYIYPGFVLYRASKQAFALIDFRDITLTFVPTHFTEAGIVPSDSEIVGSTWSKCNKDGSPDRRFRGNRQIPVARYGRLLFASSDGLDVRYLCSNARVTEEFARAWRMFHSSFNAPVSDAEQDRGQAQGISHKVLRVQAALQRMKPANDAFINSVRASTGTGTVPNADLMAYMTVVIDLTLVQHNIYCE